MIYRSGEYREERVYHLGINVRARFCQCGSSYLYKNGDWEYICASDNIYSLIRGGVDLFKKCPTGAYLDTSIHNSFSSGHWIWVDKNGRYHIMLHDKEIQESIDNRIGDINTSELPSVESIIDASVSTRPHSLSFKINIKGSSYDIQRQ